MRRKDDTLRDTLLHCARNVADIEGIEAVNIRSIAKKAGVAAGTVYNYFSNKDELLLALTEEYWKQTLTDMRKVITAVSFCGQLEEIYLFLREQIDRSGGKLMNSLGNAAAAGEERMAVMQSSLEASIIRRMEQDTDIRRDIWDESFTKEQFARFIMMNLLLLLKAEEPDFQFFITIVKRMIY